MNNFQRQDFAMCCQLLWRQSPGLCSFFSLCTQLSMISMDTICTHKSRESAGEEAYLVFIWMTIPMKERKSKRVHLLKDWETWWKTFTELKPSEKQAYLMLFATTPPEIKMTLAIRWTSSIQGSDCCIQIGNVTEQSQGGFLIDADPEPLPIPEENNFVQW